MGERAICKICKRKRNADKLYKIQSILLSKSVYVCKEHLTNDPKILLPSVEGDSLLKYLEKTNDNKSDSSSQNN